MNLRFVAFSMAASGLLGFASAGFAAKVTADLAPPQRREAAVDTAERLTRRPEVAPVPAEMPSPFNPPGFDQPDPSTAPAPGPSPASGAVPVAPPPKPPGDREILETLAMRLTPSGMMVAPGGRSLLIIDRNRFEVGTKFIVTYNEQDYELELVAIDRTTFTLRYRGEEITRPIKPASK